MSETTHLTDRMPAVAHGRAAWSDADRAHLSACTDCALEWTLVRTAAGLGRGVERTVAPMAVAEAVRVRLAAPPSPRASRRRRWAWSALGAAAAVVLLAVGRGRPEPVDAPGLPLLPEIELLEAAELQAVLELLPVGATVPSGFRTLEDLTEEELEGVLRSMEGS